MSVLTDSNPDTGDTPDTSNPTRAIVVSIGLTVAALLTSVVGGVALIIPVLSFDLDIQSVPVFLVLTAAGQLGFLLVGYVYARYADIQVRLVIPDRSDLAYVIGGTGLALAVAVGLSVLLQSFGLLPGSVIADVGTANPDLYLGLAVLSVVLIAPSEEFLFRGVIQTRLGRAFGPVSATVGASLLFGSMHLANYTGRLLPIVAGALLIAVVGAVFGTLYERTTNLAVPILVHGIYNVVLMSIAFLTS